MSINPSGERVRPDTSLVLYNLRNAQKTTILTTPNSINIRNIKIAENKILATYADQNNMEHFIIYDMEKNNITHELNLSKIRNEPYSHTAYIILAEEGIFLFYKTDNRGSLDLIKIGYDFELIDYISIDVHYDEVVDLFECQGNIYILTDIQDTGIISIYDIYANKITPLIEFEAINNTESIFLMDIQAFHIIS